MRLINVGVSLGWLVINAAFGQAVRTMEAHSGYRKLRGITEFPCLRAQCRFVLSFVDISVLVQDAITGEVVPTTSVMIQLVLHSQPDKTLCYVATTEAATNKLFKAAVFDLPEPGHWRVNVTVDGGQGIAQLHFELEASATY